ncbi:MAG: glycoside hydrolase family 104 protein [Pseudobacteriovorax sp.]|nr:glycoside hydrolase family 104 protein [Pseudobacteriovorax sp.]
MRKLWLLIISSLFLISCGSEIPKSKLDDAPSGHYILIGSGDTYLKKTQDQSSTLELGSEKCTLYENTYIPIQTPALIAGQNHYRVNLRRIIPGCSFSRGYVYIPHVVATSRIDGSQGGRLGAFLSMLAYAEGTHSRYNIRFGGFTFNGYARHPRIVYCAGSLCSDAAGRYQFLSTTWDGLGYPDFTPANQDKGAVRLMARRGVSLQEVNNIRTFQQFSQTVYKLNLEWASLPGSPYGQPTYPMNTLWSQYQSFL